MAMVQFELTAQEEEELLGALAFVPVNMTAMCSVGPGAV